jgi:hypothetical protein
MKNALCIALMTVGTVACAETTPEVMSPDIEALVASSPEWTPADVTRDLPMDEAMRQELETALGSLHATMLELHRRHEVAETLEGDARSDYLAALHADATALHAQHKATWVALDPALAEQVKARLHERMRAQHDDSEMTSIHERIRRHHGAAHDVPGRRHEP